MILPTVNKIVFHWLLLICFSSIFCITVSQASDVEVRLSSREAYVGSPLVLQITIVDGDRAEPPSVPKVEGLNIESAGTPSQRSEVSIVNGRYSESRSIVYSYRITPTREGKFRIPAFEVDAGDEIHQVDGVTFVATKSEAGNLLFVEVVGNKDSAYVGEPVDLSLKIWIKPFVDRDRKIKLSEGDMWNCVTKSTSWGPFSDRMNELAANGQRPGGEEVLKEDDTGTQRSYYLFQIDAPIYPTRTGKLDMEDVRIVVNYPEELGVSKSPFGRMMRPPGGIFDDNFFGSPFGDRLVVSQQRPIVGEVKVDNTEIIPVPTEGQPADYQGAVGEYDIAVTVGKTAVAVGEPIPVQIDIRGTGRLDLVQAPRLDQVKSLTNHFRVPSQTLAGTTMGPVKYFDTTIRPLDESVKQIPPVPFSFFDPVEEKYKTVYSKPIPIQVSPGETLSLDSIVADQRSTTDEGSTKQSITIEPLTNWDWFSPSTSPDLENEYSAQMLVSQNASQKSDWRWIWLAVAPMVWLIGALLQWRHVPGRTWNALRSNEKRFRLQLEQAETGKAVGLALADFISSACQSKMENSAGPHASATSVRAVGGMRLLGMYRLAATVESFLDRNLQEFASSDELNKIRMEADSLAEQFVQQLQASRPTSVKSRVSVAKLARQSAIVILLCGLVGSPKTLSLAGPSVIAASESEARLSQTLQEATQLYQSALQQEQAKQASEARSSEDGAAAEKEDQEIRDLELVFHEAAKKYQWVIDSGIANPVLYRSTGNAYAKAGKIGPAIYYYQLAHKLSPMDPKTQANLEWVTDQVVNPPSLVSHSSWRDQVLQWLPNPWPLRLGAAFWFLFWAVLIARQWGASIHWCFPTALLIALLVSLGFVLTREIDESRCVLLTDTTQVYQSDGTSFPVVAQLKESSGWQLPVLDERGQWIEIQYSKEASGWVPKTGVGLF